MKTQSELVKKLHIPIYHYNVFIVLSDDIISSRKKRNKDIGLYEDEDSDGNITGMHCYNTHYPDSYIFLTLTSGAGTIAHECYHTARRIFNYIGDGSNVSNEVFAYTLEWLVNECHELVDKKVKSLGID